MRCDDLRTIVADGAPLDEAARAHLAECAACGDEFPELRALTSLRPSAPDSLRDRVLTGFPERRASRWAGLVRAAAVLIVGVAVGYMAKSTRVVEVPGPTVTVEKLVEKPVPDDYLANVAIAGQRVYGKMVDVKFDPQIHVRSITIDPYVKSCEQFCPVARQLGSLAERRPDLVSYKKKEY